MLSRPAVGHQRNHFVCRAHVPTLLPKPANARKKIKKRKKKKKECEIQRDEVTYRFAVFFFLARNGASNAGVSWQLTVSATQHARVNPIQEAISCFMP